MSTAATPVAAAPKVSWLKKIGLFFGKILGIVATETQSVEKIAVPVAEALLPQFVPMIQTADGIFSNIVKEAVAAESAAAAVGQAAGTGVQKLAAVLTNSGPMIDNWIASNFPGAAQVSTAAKSGLISAVVAILNEVDGGSIVDPLPTAPAQSGSASTTAVTS